MVCGEMVSYCDAGKKLFNRLASRTCDQVREKCKVAVCLSLTLQVFPCLKPYSFWMLASPSSARLYTALMRLMPTWPHLELVLSSR